MTRPLYDWNSIHEYGKVIKHDLRNFLCYFLPLSSLFMFLSLATASVARAWSLTFDNLVGLAISQRIKNSIPINLSGTMFSEYPDILAVLLIFLVTALLSFGVSESALMGKIFTGINVTVLGFVFVAGLVKGDRANWSLTLDDYINATNVTDPELIEKGFGLGGFAPFGIRGILSGAATCFYAFVGFDCIAASAEEALDPRRSIPISIVASLLCCFVAYSGVSTALTLMMPYYLLDTQTPLPKAFDFVDLAHGRYVVAVGSLCALSTSLLGCMLPLPRVIHAMASDGLIFSFLSQICEKTKTPLLATVISGVVAAPMALLFDLDVLVDLMSIGTLLAYTLVALCVLVLRYQPSIPDDGLKTRTLAEAGSDQKIHREGKEPVKELVEAFTPMRLLRPKTEIPTNLSGSIAYGTTAVLLGLVLILCSVLGICWNELVLGQYSVVANCAILTLLSLLCLLIIWRQPQTVEVYSFKVPLVPVLPLISIFLNVALMMQLSLNSWIPLAVWIAVGFAIYFTYGIRNSSAKFGGVGTSTPLSTEEMQRQEESQAEKHRKPP
ncbi:unnamed protein product [Boreogadus saida]